MCAFRNEEANVCDNKQTHHDINAKAQVTQQHDDIMQIKFVLDSGATQHMVNDERYFDKLEDINKVEISVAKRNQNISAKQQGEILIKTFYDGDSSVKAIQDVLLVKDLMSIRSLTKKGYRILFEGDYAYASVNGQTKFAAHANGRLYEVVLHVDQSIFAGFSDENNIHRVSQSLWHFRLSHLNVFDMKSLIDYQMIDGISKINVDTKSRFCHHDETCVMGKQTRSSFPKNKNTRSSRILKLIHSDVCGPMPMTAYDGSRYFVTFTDDFSRASMICCIQRKSEVLEKFKEFIAMAESLHGNKIAKLKADNGGEYVSNQFKHFCKDKGIQMTLTVPYNPEMNSVAERLNRTLQEKVMTMLLASGLESKFWNEAIVTANYIKNRTPTSAIGTLL